MQNIHQMPLRNDYQQHDDVSILKKELTSLCKRFNIINEFSTGQVVLHFTSGNVGKIWANLEIK